MGDIKAEARGLLKAARMASSRAGQLPHETGLRGGSDCDPGCCVKCELLRLAADLRKLAKEGNDG